MDEYREGKVKRTSGRGVKKTLKPCARRAFCIMSLRVAVAGEAKRQQARSRSESEPEEGAEVGHGRRETG